ncbi:small-conductance mechanosensitive channel [Nitrosospira multiformis]|uniref:Small-conductance mechanosensitive channel n=1 Tax=Nitrosospira multiformis TaxID=1231 RepID=A0A2T5ICG3_9PROT|nr:mechanosensitive ion channel domain-containing protein [Nitrosospira multiformis]PTQ81516.1 small-conductance mechanosensitive channel [Nitrosospira multiformis]
MSLNKILTFVAIGMLLPIISVSQAGAEEQATQSPLTPAQARRTLSILQDDAKRAELEQTLRAIAQATAEAPLANTSDEVSAPAATSDSDQSPAAVQTNGPSSSGAPPAAGVPIEIAKGGLVAQIFDLIGERLHIVVNQLRAAVQTLLQIRTVGDWWQNNLGVPERRAIVLEALLELALILGGALFTEWVLRRALRHPRRMIEDRAAVRQNASDRQKDHEERAKEKAGPEKEVNQAAPHLQSATSMHVAPGPGTGRATAVDRHWSLLRRFPFALGYWLLELVPVGGFVAGATLLLTVFGGRSSIFYTTTIPLISAYANTRIALSIGHLMASPIGQRLRLMHISDEAANFLNLWLRRIVIAAVFGTAIADIALETGATLDTHDALSKLVALVVHIMLLIMIFRSRKEVAAAIRGSAENSQVLAGLRRLLADSWLFVATFLIVGAWLLGSMGTENGFQHMLHIFALSAVVIISASLASIFVLGAIDRAFIADRKNTPEQQGQQLFEGSAEAGTKSPYHLLIHRAVSLLIAVVTGLVLLRVWGVDTLSWFESGSVGRRVASAVVTITVTCALALAAWESLNTAICRRIDRWGKAGDIARAARLRTLLPMLRTTMSAVFIMIVLLAALDELGITIAPLLAGASIIGVALGFGSQKLVQDFITGIFLLMENAIQVGDFITVADLSGSVEHLSIRTVWLRAPDGSLHVVPFSSVSTVTNTNRGIGNASIRVSVTADSDVEKVFAAIKSVVDDMRADPRFKDLILSEADIWGVDQMDGFMITILGQIRTLDKGRWPVQRGFNLRILERFRESNIRFVNPQKRQVVMESNEIQVGSEPYKPSIQTP